MLTTSFLLLLLLVLHELVHLGDSQKLEETTGFGNLPLQLEHLLVLLFDSFATLDLSHSITLGATLVVLFPAGNLTRQLLDADSLGVVTEHTLELGMVKNLLTRKLGQTNSVIRERHLFTVVVLLIELAVSVFGVTEPEGGEADNHLVDLPDRVPALGMHVRDAHADAVILSAESAILSEQLDVGSVLGIVFRAGDLTQVVTTVEAFLLESEDDVVPFENIFGVRQANESISDLSMLLDLSLNLFSRHAGLSVEAHHTSLILLHSVKFGLYFKL